MLGRIASNPRLAGVLVGIGSGAPHLALPEAISVILAALTLSLIAGIYVGFAVVNGSETAFGVELGAALAYSLIALLGVVVSRWWLPLGLLAHAAWDLIHRRERSHLVDPPRWYVPFCVVVDIVLAAILALAWLD